MKRSFAKVLALFLASLMLALPASAQEEEQQRRRQIPEREKIPYDLDPTAPGLSREERVKRQEAYIRYRMRQAREKQREEADHREERLQQARELYRQYQGKQVPPEVREQVEEYVEGRADSLPGQTPTKPETIASASSSIADGETVEIPRMTFYLEPASIAVHPGETFATQVRLLNLEKGRADRIELTIGYPAGVLEPVSIHDAEIRGRLKGEPEGRVDPERGAIFYSAEFERPVAGLSAGLITVVWKALEPVERTEIDLRAGGRLSAAWLGPVRLTRNDFGPEGPLLGSVVRIVPREVAPMPPTRYRAWEMTEAYADAPGLTAQPPTVRIEYERKPVYEPGEWVVFDVAIDNPEGASFDEVRLVLQYDPRVIEFSDADRGNWIRRGINLLDGPFRERWAWDYHLDNEILPESGRMIYRMKRARLGPMPSGTVARAVGRVKKTATPPLLELVLGEDAEGRPATGLFRFGKNLLETGSERQTAENSAAASSADPTAEKADPSEYRF